MPLIPATILTGFLGSGKTTLLVKSIIALNDSLPLAVIEGDQQTDNDAARIRSTGAPALQNPGQTRQPPPAATLR